MQMLSEIICAGRRTWWWANDTKLPKRLIGAHLPMHCIIDRELSGQLRDIEDNEIRCEEGLENMLTTKNELLIAKNESKLIGAWYL